MMNRGSRLTRTLFLLSILCAQASANEPIVEQIDYVRAIKPLLKSKCYACHGVLKQEAGLRLDTGRSIRQGSKNGEVVSAGKGGGSLLERIKSNDNSIRMPPEGEPLTAEQVAKVAQWIEQQAVSPDDEQPEPDPRRHWAFQPPIRAEVPREVNSDWLRNPLDAFLSHEQIRHHLTPRPVAPKNVLLRRVFLDLIGVPPSSDELHEFLADDSPDAYAKVVDRLLNSVQYGERWGRHWMDIWRYSDWFGRRYVPDVWNSAPQIWRWRDWIVNSLNADKGYGQMVAEMLAADEIAPEDDEAGYATGYLIRNWYALNPNDWMRSNVEHTGKAFLGLTFNCAHCHDHKYDPISQDDYFRLRAFFEPISIRQDRVPGEDDPGPFDDYKYGILRKIIRLGAVRIFDKTPDAPTWFYTSGDERNRVADRGSIAPGMPAFLNGASLKIAPVKLPTRAWYPGLRPAIHQTELSRLEQALAATESQLPSARESVGTKLPELRTQLAETETEFLLSCRTSEQSGHSLALAGQQSLLIDSTSGRRIVHHGLRDLKSLDDGTTISFQLQIVKDSHINFQLAKDVTSGLTAGLVAFDHGKVLSYLPGTFNEFEVGKYDFAAGQNRFGISLTVTNEDRCILTVRSLPANLILVDQIPVARNGWNPIGNASMAMTFDVRTGSIALLDNITISATNAGEPVAALGSQGLIRIDFESPVYRDRRDVIGIDGWFGSTFSQPGATSVISAVFGDDSLNAVSQKLNVARRAVDVYELKLKSLEAKRLAVLATMESLNARIAADQAKYGEATNVDTVLLAKTASQLHRKAAVLTAEADILASNQFLATAETKPPEDANRSKDLEVANKQLSAAALSLDKAQAALSDPTQSEHYPALSPVYPETSTGRRRALAEWIAGRDNPLAARVAVNHIWLRHFHVPIVSSVYDFGINGAAPTNPQLLDWLAVELMESGWSMKHLHRMIVTSNAYAMSSHPGHEDDNSRSIDPENKFLWRMNQGRMEAEVVRDSLLSVAGRIDRQMGGQELENSQALTTRRRTLYYCCQPEIDGKSAFGALFDAPEPADCYRRTQSIIPQQALALTNSDLVHELSVALAGRLWQSLSPEEQAEPSAYVISAYEQILTRVPTEIELKTCLEFLAATGNEVTNPGRVREALVRVLLNHNDFVAIR